MMRGNKQKDDDNCCDDDYDEADSSWNLTLAVDASREDSDNDDDVKW